MEPQTTLPVNPALAFEPVTTDAALELSTSELFGFKIEDTETRDRMFRVVQAAYEDFDTYAEGLSYISKVVATPQEFGCTVYMFLKFVEHMCERQELCEALGSAIIKSRSVKL